MAVSNSQRLDRVDVMKLSAAALIVVVTLIAFYYFSEAALLYRVIGLLAGFGAAVFLFVLSDPGQRLYDYLRQVRSEVRRVVWPNKQETMQTTAMVLVIVFLVGLFLWLLDSIFGWVFRLVTGIGG